MTKERSAIWSWALYDWANSAFATTVMAGFFPVFFKEYWSYGTSPAASTAALGIANSISSLGIALLAPLLGAMADQGLGKKKFLGVFTLLGATTTATLFWVPAGAWSEAVFLYGLASFAFAAALVFYDALLIDVSPPESMDMVSSLGYAVGYLGGGILFAVNVCMYIKPNWFGLESGVDGVRWSFLAVSLWWLIFSGPIFFRVQEKNLPPHRPPLGMLLKRGWGDFVATLKRMKSYRPLMIFLIAYLLYIDGVNTIIKMAVDYGMALGLTPQHLIGALLVVQFVGFPAAVGFGFFAQKWGARRGVFVCLWIYAAITGLAFQMSADWHFYVLAGLIGLAQGGVQALSRSMYARMIPANEAGEFFGFFNLLGKFSAILGPLLMGMIALWTQEPRWSILVLLLMFVGGGLTLRLVDPNYRVPSS